MKKKVIFIVLGLICIPILVFAYLYLSYNQNTNLYKNEIIKENRDLKETFEAIRLEGAIVDIDRSLSQITSIKLDVKDVIDTNNNKNISYIGKTLDLKCNLDLKSIDFKDDLKAGAIVVIDIEKHLKGQKEVLKVIDKSIYYRKNGIYYNREGLVISFPNSYQIASRDYSVQGIVKKVDKGLKYIVVEIEKNSILSSTNPTEYDFKEKEISFKFLVRKNFYNNEIEDIKSKLKTGTKVIIKFANWSTPTGKTVLGFWPNEIYYFKNNKIYDVNESEIKLPKL